MKLGNEALKKVVDEAITTAKADGTYVTLYTKWIGEAPPQADRRAGYRDPTAPALTFRPRPEGARA